MPFRRPGRLPADLPQSLCYSKTSSQGCSRLCKRTQAEASPLPFITPVVLTDKSPLPSLPLHITVSQPPTWVDTHCSTRCQACQKPEKAAHGYADPSLSVNPGPIFRVTLSAPVEHQRLLPFLPAHASCGSIRPPTYGLSTTWPPTLATIPMVSIPSEKARYIGKTQPTKSHKIQGGNRNQGIKHTPNKDKPRKKTLDL